VNRLAWLCAGRVGTCMGTMAFAGAMPVLRTAWNMDAATAGSIQTVFNLTNAFALLAAAWLSDSLGARRVYSFFTWAGACALACFALFARSPDSALMLIGFVGVTQGGSYAPALMLAAELSERSKRGQAMGRVLAAGSFGYLLSVFAALSMTRMFGPVAGFGTCAAGAFAGAIIGRISLAGMPEAPHTHAKSRAQPIRWSLVFSPASVALLIGYVAHCWELLGNWAWTPSLLAAALQHDALGPVSSGLIVAAVIHLSGMLATAIFGTLSDRWPRSHVLIAVGAAGALCSMLLGWSVHWGAGWTIALAAIGSFFILGDSGVLTAAMTDEVPPGALGRVMGVRSVLGFGAGAMAPAVFGATLDSTHQWGWAYMTLGLGGIMACVAALCFERISQTRSAAVTAAR
jgi:MFS family permease